TSDVNNVYARSYGQLFSNGTPVRTLTTVDNVISTKPLKWFCFVIRACRGNDSGPSRLCELHSEDANSAGTLSKDPLARSERSSRQTEKGVPGRQSRGGQRCGFCEAQTIPHYHESFTHRKRQWDEEYRRLKPRAQTSSFVC